MSLLGHDLNRQFIARPDAAKEEILYKWPDQTIRKLTQVTVQPDETALFVKEGKVAGTLPPGRSTLDGALIPFLGDIVDWASGGNMYRAELYFIGTREFVSLPFGGPIDNVEDPETRLAVGLRVFGEYALVVSDPAAVILKLVGTRQAIGLTRMVVVVDAIDRQYAIGHVARRLIERLDRGSAEHIDAPRKCMCGWRARDKHRARNQGGGRHQSACPFKRATRIGSRKIPAPVHRFTYPDSW